MLTTTYFKRKFIIKEKDGETELTDPEQKWSPEKVMEFYSGDYPLLTTANVRGPVTKDGCRCYYFESIMGTKG